MKQRWQQLCERTPRWLRAIPGEFLLAFALGLGLCFSRLLGVHGVESALALGLVLPPLAAFGAASALRRSRLAAEQRPKADPGLAAEPVGGSWPLYQTAERAVLLWAVPVAILGLNQLRIRQCEPAIALGFMVLGPLPGVLLAAFCGHAMALLVPRWQRAAAVAVPMLWLLRGLWAFWSTPAIFVFGHFGGFFPGTLYDDDVTLPAALWTFRALTLLWLLVVALGIALAEESGRLKLRRLIRNRRGSAVLLLALAVALFGEMKSPQLGHSSSVAHIDEVLGAQQIGERCIVHVPRELAQDSQRRLLEDCDFRVRRAEGLLGVSQSEKVHAFFYRNTEEKRRLMGAGRTYIAKPWRSEVHLQLGGWPHRVLAHEVVHVVAGNAADGPFRVAGRFGGYFPNPGWIEGIAVAIEWPTVDGLDPHQSVAALRRADRLPPLRQVMSTGFLVLPPRIAYASAGSFVAYAMQRFGAEAVREAHRAADATSLGSWEDLEAGWHEHLDAQQLPDGAQALSELRFARSSIFATTCPHRLAQLRLVLGGDLAAGDTEQAAATCREMLEIEPGAIDARSALVAALAREGDMEAANAELEHLAGAVPPIRDRAQESIADALWQRGEFAEAQAIYEELLSHPQPENEARNREVKLDALRRGGEEAEAIRALLLGDDGRGTNAPEAMFQAQRLSRLRSDGLGPYLQSRQLFFQERHALALELLDEALERGLATERLRREAHRMRGICLYALGRTAEAETQWQALSTDPLLRNEARDWLARIADVP